VLICMPDLLRTHDQGASDRIEVIQELKGIISRLEEAGIDYALCGGLAMAVYAMPRATLDIDLMIQVQSLAEAGRAVATLGYSMHSAPMDLHGAA